MIALYLSKAEQKAILEYIVFGEIEGLCDLPSLKDYTGSFTFTLENGGG